MVLLQDGETLSWCDDNIAVGSVELTGKNLQECGFAGTVGTDQTVAVSLCKFTELAGDGNGRKYRKFDAVFRAMCGKDETNSCSFYKGWLNPG